MAISDFVFGKSQGSLQWVNGGRKVRILAAGLEQAQADTVNDRVLALQAAQGLPNRLKVFSATGQELADLPPPEGFQFYYLTPYSKLGVAVVCVTTEPVAGFRDWHFGLDLARRRLFRHAPSY
jgi:hypothetical protein